MPTAREGEGSVEEAERGVRNGTQRRGRGEREERQTDRERERIRCPGGTDSLVLLCICIYMMSCVS